ncbi:hypothetical protein R1flu_007077 [Riccia fluitans]|uniref:RRM domain-containing protein n=1 Tax=Riccia fluitans TaxID=41844 RepID=A0ABD1YXU1_9MARC
MQRRSSQLNPGQRKPRNEMLILRTSGRSEKWKGMDDAINGNGRRVRTQMQRRISFKVESHLGGDKQVPSSIGRNRNHHKSYFSERRVKNVICEKEVSARKQTESGEPDEGKVFKPREFNNQRGGHISYAKRILLLEKKRQDGVEEVKPSKSVSKRSRDENSERLVELKRQKREHHSERRSLLPRMCGTNETKPAVVSEAPLDEVHGISAYRLKASVYGTPTNKSMKIGMQGRKSTTSARNGSQLDNRPHHDDVQAKHREREISDLYHGPGSDDSFLGRKERLSTTMPDHSARHAELRVSKCGRGGVGDHRDGIRSRRQKATESRKLESDLNASRNTNRIGEKSRASTIEEPDKGPKHWHRRSDLALSSTAVGISDPCMVEDYKQTAYDYDSVISNGWEFKNRFRSKVVVPVAESEEAPEPNGGCLLRENGQQEKNSVILKEVGQEDRSQKVEDLDKTRKNGLSRTREACSQRPKNSVSKGAAERVDPAHGFRYGLTHRHKPKLDFEIKVNSTREAKESGKIFPKLRNFQTSRKLQGSKNDSGLRSKNNSRQDAQYIIRKMSKGLRCTRSKETVLKKSPEISPSKTVKEEKESKRTMLKRRTTKVGGARGDEDDGYKRLSSDEPIHRRPRGRLHSASPKLREHESQKKEHHGKSIFPRGTEKDVSDWEKFERERSNNTTLAAFDSRYRRFGGRTSGLGGYSPRRRRSEAAIKTPSPPPRSPDRRKPRAWDLPPPGMDRSMVAAISTAHHAVAVVQHAVIQQAAAAIASVAGSSVMLVSPGATSASVSCGFMPTAPPPMIPSPLQQVNPAVSAVSLTQATRPLRRLYVGNVPATVSDGELMEFVNAAMLSANANHLAGTKPCINCSVNVEKSYAFAEFITPEDATAALAFDGVTLHGTTLKIRRPKDFVPPANGEVQSASPILDMVSNTVPDSPRKVFVGGISSTLSAEKYMDPEATLRACAGLNGIKLGTRFLTVVQATPDPSPEMTRAETPFYGVPEQAKPLLQPPSRILELQNLVTEEEMSVLSKQEVDEITEDIRLECSRFGNVKSMLIVPFKSASEPGKQEEMPSSDKGSSADPNATTSNRADREILSCSKESSADPSPSILDHANVACDKIRGRMQSQSIDGLKVGNFIPESDDPPNVLSSTQTADICGEDGSLSIGLLHSDRYEVPNTSGIEAHTGFNDDEVLKNEELCLIAGNTTGTMKTGGKNRVTEFAERINNDGGHGLQNEESEMSSKEVDTLNVGRVYVEFSREDSACQAAHSLHGRTFGGRMVTVSYFPLKMYQKKFLKGLGPCLFKEKQALVVQSHLTAHIKC